MRPSLHGSGKCQFVQSRFVARPTKDSGPFPLERAGVNRLQGLINNLKTAGCPETTIQDIITADVHSLFLGRRAQFMNTGRNKFWQADYCAAHPSPEVAALEQEEASVLQQLLGPTAAR